MINAWAPGKLFVAGEYAVTEPGHAAVLTTVGRGATVTVISAPPGRVHLRSDIEGGSSLVCRRSGDRLVPQEPDTPAAETFSYVLSAIAVVERLAAERGRAPRPFTLSIATTLTRGSRSLGLGSSAAVTVATVSAVGACYQLGLHRMDRYRLAMLATLPLAPHNSGGDVAAAVWGGWIVYCSPDRDRIPALTDYGGVTTALREPWPRLSIRALPIPRTVRLCIGWTGEKSSSSGHLTALHRGKLRYGMHYHRFLADSDACVHRLVAALDGKPAAAQREIRYACRLLRDLDSVGHLGIFTPRLDALCAAAEALGAASKPSGAGGGDCGIALIDLADDRSAELSNRWEAIGIHTLPLDVQAIGQQAR
ncbi:phosphomevalonate kinase [Nocardia sp. NPDC050408]|uniref:phosphomevalonate kinase n=1 Tax=Nocardia sp. NPDC050408 TaxID=3364319 RepID=UPI00378D9536